VKARLGKFRVPAEGFHQTTMSRPDDAHASKKNEDHDSKDENNRV
jgi:hypothetical protein